MNEILSTQAMYGDILTGNPLIDALPKQLTLQQLYSKLMCVPELANNYKKLPPQERYILTENINKLFIPLDFAAIVYNLLYTGIRSSYQGKTIRSIIQRLNEFGQYIFYRMPNTLKDSTTQAECFSVLGESGMGKTQTITRILDLFPQVIHHTEYDGHPFEHDQIVYIKIESPANNSPRGACLQILSAIDDILGTDLCAEERKHSSNLDMLTTRIAQACTRYSVGCIVIDEIQNILTSVSDFVQTSGGRMVNFLVELANKTGVCLVFVGTPQVARVFDMEPHLLRRTRGPRIPVFERGEAFDTILNTMWDIMPVLYPLPLDESTRDLIFRITGGTIAKMQKLILLSAQHAIYFETETVTKELLKKTARQYNIVPGKSILEAASSELLTVPKRKAQQTVQNGLQGKGRPKVEREADDILQIYTECQNKGWSVAKTLIQRGLAERGIENAN